LKKKTYPKKQENKKAAEQNKKTEPQPENKLNKTEPQGTFPLSLKISIQFNPPLET
jgi:hypothetical protein